MTTSMLGPETVAAVVADAFAARVPVSLAQLAVPVDEGGLGPLAGLDDPKLYATSDRFRVELGQYPAVLVVPQGTGQVIPLDFDVDDDAEVFRFRYTLRAYCYVRASGRRAAGVPVDTFDEVAKLRNRLMLALRLAIFRQWQLTADVQFVPPSTGSTYRESLSEAGIDPRDQRAISGGYIELQVDALEGASIPPLGDVSTVAVTLGPIADD